MKNKLLYKGYEGSVEVCLESEELYGSIQNVGGLWMYSGNTVSELKNSFIESVEAYIEYYRSLIKQPTSDTFPSQRKIF